jgi:predicted nucleic acid-binding protein
LKRLLIDTNIVLDALLGRQPHFASSAGVWAGVEGRHAEGLLAGHAVTTIHYLLAKELGTPKANTALNAILSVFTVAAIDDAVIRDALRANFRNFEDAVTAAAAFHAACDLIVTRNPRDFRHARVSAITPEMALPLLR